MERKENKKSKKLKKCFLDEFYSKGISVEELVRNVRPIASFAGGDTYELVKATNVHAHPLFKGYPSQVAPFIMLRAEGGRSDSLYQVMKTLDLNPCDKVAVKELAFDYPNVVDYIHKRLKGRGFNKAPIPYRFYVLRQVYSYNPVFQLGYNPQGLIYLSFNDAKIADPEHLIDNSVNAYGEYKKYGIIITDEDHKRIEGERLIIEKEINLRKLEGEDRKAFVKTRVNQSVFRDLLIRKYKKCCLCGIDEEIFLIASHIKPWVESTGVEKTDVNNGLLLCPNHDKLFDAGYISFDDNGKLLISHLLSKTNQVFMNVECEMRIDMSPVTKEYMQYHRTIIFKK